MGICSHTPRTPEAFHATSEAVNDAVNAPTSSGKPVGSTITPPYRSAACASVAGEDATAIVCVELRGSVAVASCAAFGMSDERARESRGRGNVGGVAATRARATVVASAGPRAGARETAERADTSRRWPNDALEGLGNAAARRRTGDGAREKIRDANTAVVAQAIAHFRDIAEWRREGAVPRTRPAKKKTRATRPPSAGCHEFCIFDASFADCAYIRVFE